MAAARAPSAETSAKWIGSMPQATASGISTGIDILLAYGSCSFASKMGQLAGSHFLTVMKGKERMRELFPLAYERCRRSREDHART